MRRLHNNPIPYSSIVLVGRWMRSKRKQEEEAVYNDDRNK